MIPSANGTNQISNDEDKNYLPLPPTKTHTLEIYVVSHLNIDDGTNDLCDLSHTGGYSSSIAEGAGTACV
jgi:hypothetical protein